MAIDYTYGIEQGWLKAPTAPEQEDSQLFALENRGTWMDLISSGARGVAGATEQVGYGLEQLGVENPLPEVVKEARKCEALKRQNRLLREMVMFYQDQRVTDIAIDKIDTTTRCGE